MCLWLYYDTEYEPHACGHNSSQLFQRSRLIPRQRLPTRRQKIPVWRPPSIIHYNDFNCLDIQKELGVDYLYPDQKYTIWATSPGSGNVNVNVLLLKVDDYEKIQIVRPTWDAVKKTWVYDGISPLIQLNDISTPQEKTITIKNQGKYFLCADDRKESGINDAILRVPVKITRL